MGDPVTVAFPPINYGLAIRNVPVMKMTPLSMLKIS